MGAFGEEGRSGDLASVQAATEANAEQASKRITQETTRQHSWKSEADEEARANKPHSSCRGIGGGMQATGIMRNTGSPDGDRSSRSTGSPRGTGRAARGGGEARSTDEAG